MGWRIYEHVAKKSRNLYWTIEDRKTGQALSGPNGGPSFFYQKEQAQRELDRANTPRGNPPRVTATKPSPGRHKMPYRAGRLSPDMADAIAEDLPDGAYYAMMEELTGMDGADVIMALSDYEED